MDGLQGLVDSVGGQNTFNVLTALLGLALVILVIWGTYRFKPAAGGTDRAGQIDRLVRENTDLQHKLLELANRLEKLDKGADAPGQAAAKAIHKAVGQLADERAPHRDVAMKSQVAKRMGWKVTKDIVGDQKDARSALSLHAARQNELVKSADELVQLMDAQQQKVREVKAVAEAIAQAEPARASDVAVLVPKSRPEPDEQKA